MRRKTGKYDVGRAAAFMIAAAFLLLLGLLSSAEAAVSIATPGSALRDGASSTVGFNAGGHTMMAIELTYTGGEPYEGPPIYEGTVAGVPNPFTWTVPVSMINSANCRLRITCWTTGADEQEAVSGLFTIDNTAPEFTLEPVADPAIWTKGPVRIEFEATDPVVQQVSTGIDYYKVSVEGRDDYGEQVSPFDLDVASFPTGTYTAHVTANDIAGNQTTKDVMFQVDNTAPAAFDATTDKTGWRRDNVSISFSTSDPTPGSGVIDHYAVSVDGGPFSTHASPYTMTEEGVHTVTVRAFDGAVPVGNFRDATATTRIDRTAPNLDAWSCMGDAGGAAVQLDYTVSDAMSGVKRIYLWYKKGADGEWNDSGLSSTATTGLLFFPTLGDGTYYFGYVIEDNAGNFATSNTGDGVCNFTIDTGLPVFTNILATPAYAKAGDTVTITFTASEDLLDQPYLGVGLDDGVFVSQSGNDFTFTYKVSDTAEEGPIDVYIEGIDLSYNYNWTDEYGHLTIDNTPPAEFTPTANPSGWTTEPSIAISFEATDAVSGIDYYEVSIDGGAYSPEVSPYNLDTSGLSNGAHTVHVKAVDLAGNERIGAITVYTGPAIVDDTPPEDFVPRANPSTWTSANTISITFAATDEGSGIARYEVALDGGAYTQQSSPYSLDVSAVADGNHTVHVKAIDKAGNEKLEHVVISLDKTAPRAFTPVATPAQWKNVSTATITWTTQDLASGIDHYEVALDKGAFSRQSSPFTINISRLANTAHVVHVKAVDRAGNSVERDVRAIKSTTAVPSAALTFTDPKPTLGRQFDYVFWKNWMGVKTTTQNTYRINWVANGNGAPVTVVLIDYRSGPTKSWSLLRRTTAASGTVGFDVTSKPESDSYEFRISVTNAVGGTGTVTYSKFAVYDATKLAPTIRVVSPANGSTVKAATPFTAKVQVTMRVFSDPRVAGKAYKSATPDWWFAGHTLAATPVLKLYRANSSGVAVAPLSTLVASMPHTGTIQAATTTSPTSPYLRYTLVETWEKTCRLNTPTTANSTVCQLELPYASVVTIGKTRQSDDPNEPGEVLPPKSQEPLIDTLKKSVFSRFKVR